MKKYVLFISGALALSLVSSSTSSAWNGRAHMMVAAVAYNQLTQQTKNRVDTLLLLNPDRDHWIDLIPEGTSATRKKMMIFMIAATWLTVLRAIPITPRTGPITAIAPQTILRQARISDMMTSRGTSIGTL